MSLADKASLLLIPTGYKSQKVYSIFPTDGVGDFDFSRSSSATRIAKNGLITTVAANVPRLEYPMIDGVVNGCPSLILEPQRTNLITNSESLSNFVKSNITEVSGNQVTPDGTLGSIKITPTSSSLAQIQKTSLTVGSAYSISFFVKKDEASHLIINQAGSAATRVSYDIDNLTYIGIAGVNANIVSYGNGWSRIEYSVDSLTYNNIRILLSNGTGVYPYNPPVGDGLYIWGFQIEQNSYPTSYIPTTTAIATRSAETATDSGDATTFSDSEGVLMAEISTDSEDTYKYLSINNGTPTGNQTRVALGYYGSTLYPNVRVSNVHQFSEAFSVNPTLNNKIALKYKTNDFALWVNGFEVLESNSGSTFSDGTLSKFDFDDGASSSDFYGKTKQLQYYNSALTDSELEKISSWTSFTDMAQGQLYTIE